jgi:hypothetical protein
MADCLFNKGGQEAILHYRNVESFFEGQCPAVHLARYLDLSTYTLDTQARRAVFFAHSEFNFFKMKLVSETFLQQEKNIGFPRKNLLTQYLCFIKKHQFH